MSGRRRYMVCGKKSVAWDVDLDDGGRTDKDGEVLLRGYGIEYMGFANTGMHLLVSGDSWNI